MLIEQQIWQVSQPAAHCDKETAICQAGADSGVEEHLPVLE